MSQHRQFATPTYLIAFALAIIPPFDSLMQVLPFRFADARWRFGAFGLLSNSLMLSLTGLVLALLATSVFDHPLFRRVLGAVSGIAVVIVAGAWIVFALDALQVRNEIKPAAALAFKVASATAAAKAALAIVTLLAVTITSFRGRKAAAPSKAPRAGDLVVGSRGSARETAQAETTA